MPLILLRLDLRLAPEPRPPRRMSWTRAAASTEPIPAAKSHGPSRHLLGRPATTCNKTGRNGEGDAVSVYHACAPVTRVGHITRVYANRSAPNTHACITLRRQGSSPPTGRIFTHGELCISTFIAYNEVGQCEVVGAGALASPDGENDGRCRQTWKRSGRGLSWACRAVSSDSSPAAPATSRATAGPKFMPTPPTSNTPGSSSGSEPPVRPWRRGVARCMGHCGSVSSGTRV